MAVTYQTEGVKMPDIKKRETTEWIKSVAATYGKKVGEIAYIFCSDEKILEVNRQYLQHDYYGARPERELQLLCGLLYRGLQQCSVQKNVSD